MKNLLQRDSNPDPQNLLERHCLLDHLGKHWLLEFSIITLTIIENRAPWLARSFASSRYNHRAVIMIEG